MTWKAHRPPPGTVVVGMALIVISLSLVVGIPASRAAWAVHPVLMGTVLALVVLGEVAEVRMPSGRRLAPISTAAGLTVAAFGSSHANPAFEVRPAVIILVVAMAQGVAAGIRALVPRLRLPTDTGVRTGSGRWTSAGARLLGVAVTAVAMRWRWGSDRSVWSWAEDLATPRLEVAAVLLAMCFLGLVVERALASVASARREHARIRPILRDEVSEAAPLTLALVVPAPMAALSAPVIGVSAIPLALLPILFISFAVVLSAAVGSTFQQTIRTLARLTEEGGYTGRRHAERVAELARSTALRLGVTEREVRDLEFAALLHDLGQLGLNARIPAGATVLAAPHDQQAMADDGAAIIRHNADLESVAIIVEGQAMPYRSVVEYAADVPMTSRILKVCNAFDDLTGGSRDPSVMSAAVERMHLGLGYEYDPAVVLALEEVLRQRWPSPS